MISDQERHQPTRKDFDEVLGMLLAANEEGQLVGLSFMVRNGDKAAIDYRGSHDMASLMSKTVLERIAEAVALTDPDIAKAIKQELHKYVH